MTIRLKGHTLPLDADRNPVQVSSRFVTHDANSAMNTSEADNESPLTVVNSDALYTPEDAVTLWVKSADAINISEDPNLASYAGLEADTWTPIPVAGMTQVYVGCPDTSDVEFYYERVGKGA